VLGACWYSQLPVAWLGIARPRRATQYTQVVLHGSSTDKLPALIGADSA
jgi:hypothetical protein